MAMAFTNITLGYELRPCIAGTKKKKALFHRWYEDPHAGLVAVVEYEDGTVAKVIPKNIVFVGNAGKFAEFSWGDEEETDISKEGDE